MSSSSSQGATTWPKINVTSHSKLQVRIFGGGDGCGVWIEAFSTSFISRRSLTVRLSSPCLPFTSLWSVYSCSMTLLWTLLWTKMPTTALFLVLLALLYNDVLSSSGMLMTYLQDKYIQFCHATAKCWVSSPLRFRRYSMQCWNLRNLENAYCNLGNSPLFLDSQACKSKLFVQWLVCSLALQREWRFWPLEIMALGWPKQYTWWSQQAFFRIFIMLPQTNFQLPVRPHLLHAYIYLYTYMITSVPCRAACLSVCLSVCCRMSGARRGIPVDIHVTMEGPGCTGGRVRGGATSPRTKNSSGPGARQTGWIQNSTWTTARPDVRQIAVAIVAGRLPLCTCRARQLTTCDAARSRQTAEAIKTTATNFSGVCHQADVAHVEITICFSITAIFSSSNVFNILPIRDKPISYIWSDTTS